jgi:hypothetical protein
VNRYRLDRKAAMSPWPTRETANHKRKNGGPVARNEFLCRDLGKDDQGRGLVHRNARGDVGRQDAVLVRLRLMLENIPGRHRDHERANALREQLLVSVDTETDLAENTIGMVAVAAYPQKSLP